MSIITAFSFMPSSICSSSFYSYKGIDGSRMSITRPGIAINTEHVYSKIIIKHVICRSFSCKRLQQNYAVAVYISEYGNPATHVLRNL